jgi:hypothetical protein
MRHGAARRHRERNRLRIRLQAFHEVAHAFHRRIGADCECIALDHQQCERGERRVVLRRDTRELVGEERRVGEQDRMRVGALLAEIDDRQMLVATRLVDREDRRRHELLVLHHLLDDADHAIVVRAGSRRDHELDRLVGLPRRLRLSDRGDAEEQSCELQEPPYHPRGSA